MKLNNIYYTFLQATLWIIIFNLIVSNRLLHLLLLPLIIFGNYLVLTRYHHAINFYGINLGFLLIGNIVFHILLPIYIIKKENISCQFNIELAKENLKIYIFPIIILLAIYVFLVPINKIYHINKKNFFIITLLLLIIACFFTN